MTQKANRWVLTGGLLACLTAACLAGMWLLVSTPAAEAATLNLFHWADYIPDSLLLQFEQETGIRVQMDVYTSNEEMLAKLMAGGLGLYDLAVPSDDHVEIMIAQGLLEPIDHRLIPNLVHIGSQFLNPPFDPGNRYSLPYMWGTTGLAYNRRYITEPITSWADLWNPALAGRIVLLDDTRQVMGIGLQALGYSLNETDPRRLQAALEKLAELAPLVRAYDSIAPKAMLLAEEAWVAQIWSGDAVVSMQENPDIVYVLPREGGVFWQDNLVIPRGAPNREAAHAFIDFLYRPDISARLAEAFPYGTPNITALEMLPDEIRQNPAAYPDPEIVQRAEWLRDVGEAVLLYDRLFMELKRR